MFRAFTIITIVMAHMMICFGIGAEGKSGVDSDSIIFKSISGIIAGNSAFFVFISGFLFYYVFYLRGFQFGRFIAGKARNVLMPYVITILAFIAFNLIYSAISGENLTWGTMTDFFRQTFMYHAFWYIPFIMLTFALSDLHIMFIQQSFRTQVILIAVLTVVAMVLGRNNNNLLQSVFYFTPSYLFGITCAMNYERIENIKRKTWILLISIWLILIFVCSYTDNYIDAYKTAASIWPLSFAVPMKMLSCFIFLHLFRLLSSLSCSWLDKTMSFIAEFSFSIYFYHVFFVKIFYGFHIKGDTITMACYSGLLVTPAVIAVCLLISWSLKKLIGKNSKMYIGS